MIFYLNFLNIVKKKLISYIMAVNHIYYQFFCCINSEYIFLKANYIVKHHIQLP